MEMQKVVVTTATGETLELDPSASVETDNYSFTARDLMEGDRFSVRGARPFKVHKAEHVKAVWK